MKFFYHSLLFIFLLFSCNKNETSAFKNGQTLHYDIKFIDKEKITKNTNNLTF